ncbi:glycosyltransferase family 2 protein [Chloroflexus sp.]|uniref:glycosyltransferase family 2 protein n=1 Tax=Chloroflexus sp. TaxID=1904827 RepID=UPI002ACE5D41|nr:glycosyltransferase family 2 protein [Chloroflexus sp.]
MATTIRMMPTIIDLPPPPPGRQGWPWTVATPPAAPVMANNQPWPRITIVTPSYQQAPYLEEAIRSVLLQGYPNLEYIVMDGGSRDGSVAIIQRYVPWLSYWQSQPDGGQSAALADGFARATGEILAWINSDDRLQPGALQRVGQFFANRPWLAFANGDVYFIDADSRVTARIFALPPNATFTALLGVHRWPQQGCFWRRSVYEQVGGVDRSLRFCMDRDLFIRLSAAGPSRRIPGPPLGDFRLHEEAKTATLHTVWQHEHALLRRRYRRPLGNYQYAGLRLLWWLWQKHASVRNRLYRAYGVEC